MNVLQTWEILDKSLGGHGKLPNNSTKESLIEGFNMLNEEKVKEMIMFLERQKVSLDEKMNKFFPWLTCDVLSSEPDWFYGEIDEEDSDAVEKSEIFRKESDELMSKIRKLKQQLKKLQKSDIRKMRASMLHVLRREGMFTMDSKRFGKLYLSYKSEEPSPSQWQDIFTGHTWKNRRFFEGLDSFPSDKPIEMKLIDEANGHYLDPYYQLLAYVDPSGKKHLIPLPVFVDALQNDKYKELYKQSMDDVFYREDPLETALEEAKKDFNLKFETISKEEWYSEDSSKWEKNLNEEQSEE